MEFFNINITLSVINVIKLSVSYYIIGCNNALPLPVRRRWSLQAIPSTRHQRTLRDHGYGLVYHAVCLFTAQLSPGTHSSRAQTAGSRWVAWVPGSAPRWCTRPKTVTHPTLTGPGVE